MSEKPGTSQRKAKRGPTLFDVANEAGVGTTTVSRVINGGHYVDPATLSRVRSVMERLAYQPSQAARALKGEKTHSIGLIIPTLRDPFFANLASALQQVSRQRNYLLIMLASEDDPLQETAELSLFQSYRVDGMLVVAPSVQSRKFLSMVNALSIPTVALDRPLDTRCSSVVCDNYEAAKNAVQHLIDHGRRRILCLGGDPDLYTFKERVRGYEAALSGAGLRSYISPGPEPVQIANALKTQFAKGRGRPDAVFALNGNACIHAYEFLVDSQFSLPKDVALLGFDEFPLSATLRPSVSVVRQPIHDLGTTAAKILFEEIETGAPILRRIILEAELVTRSSCGCDGRAQAR